MGTTRKFIEINTQEVTHMKNYAKRKLKAQFLDDTGTKFAKFVRKYIEPYTNFA